MRFIATLFALVVLFACGPVSPPEPPHDDGGGSCASAAANLQRLGCITDAAQWEANCIDANEAGADLDFPMPVSCLTNVQTCDAAALCT